MEAGARAETTPGRRMPAWLTGLLPLGLLAAAVAVFVGLGAPGLERRGVPLEELSVERTVLRPGEIELRVVNDGPDAVRVRQVIVNDGYTGFTLSEDRIGRLGSATVHVRYPWVEGENYEVALLTATGGTIDHTIESATVTPDADLGFYGLMALIGLYVGIIPVAIGMLWLPWVRRIDPRWVRFILALTLGLLLFLGIESVLEGSEVARQAPEAFGGAALVWLGAVAAYLALAGVDAWLQRRSEEADPRRRALRLAFLVALGIGLHNLGEGLAIGSAYAIGSLALGVTLVIGFALHNTTEGLAIVAPIATQPARRRLSRLALLGLVAGGPVIVGAWLGASAFDASMAAFTFGLGAGAIARVVVQIAPSVRDRRGRLLHPIAVAGLVAGLGVMYVTGLLVPV